MTNLLYVSFYLSLSLITLVFSKLLKWLSNKNLDCNLKFAKDIIHSVVRNISQTYVEDLKKQGLFDNKAKKIALEKSNELVKELLQTKLNKDIKKIIQDYDKWLNNEIEFYIDKLKKENNQNE